MFGASVRECVSDFNATSVRDCVSGLYDFNATSVPAFHLSCPDLLQACLCPHDELCVPS